MNNKIEYHFSISLSFKEDVDVKKLSKKFDLEPYKIIEKKDAKDIGKTAKIWYRTKDLHNVNTDEEIEKFVNKIKDIFSDLPQILQEYNGECYFEIVFNVLDDFPFIGLKKDTMKVLYNLGMDFGTDFILHK